MPDAPTKIPREVEEIKFYLKERNSFETTKYMRETSGRRRLGPLPKGSKL